MVSTGQRLLEVLAARGVDTVFGVPGNHTVALYRGFGAAGIRHITCRHEQGAGFMADGYARATGRPGVCVLISGPGLLNAATAIAQANADSVPMLVITSVASLADLGMSRGTLHELPDQQRTAASICRQSHTLLAPANLPELIERAFVRFDTARPGPVHIEIPLDLMDTPVENSHSRSADVPTAADANPATAPRIATPGPDPVAVKQAAERLAAARAPLLLVGGGAQRASGAVVALAEQLDCPLLNTVNGKGICPADHPLAVGGSPSLPVLRAAMAAADVILAIGTELGETDYDLLMIGALPAHPGLIRLDIDPQQLLIPHPPALGITTDARLGSEALLQTLTSAELSVSTAEKRSADPAGGQRAAALRTAVQGEPHYHSEMQGFFDALRQAAPDTLIVGDSTRPTYYAAWQLECRQPRRYFHSVSGFGTLGYALPAAVGAALALREGVIVLIGDGGIQFTLPELTTAVEQHLPLAVVVWHNDGYREIENSMRARNVPAESTRILAPDFEAAARAHHAHFARPHSLADLTRVVSSALGADRPTLIEVREDDFLQTPSGGWYQ